MDSSQAIIDNMEASKAIIDDVELHKPDDPESSSTNPGDAEAPHPRSNLMIYFDTKFAELKRLGRESEWDRADTLASIMLGDDRLSIFHRMYFHLYLSSRYETPVYHAREALRLIEVMWEEETNKEGLLQLKTMAEKTLETGTILERILSQVEGSAEDVEMDDDQFTDGEPKEDDPEAAGQEEGEVEAGEGAVEKGEGQDGEI